MMKAYLKRLYVEYLFFLLSFFLSFYATTIEQPNNQAGNSNSLRYIKG